MRTVLFAMFAIVSWGCTDSSSPGATTPSQTETAAANPTQPANDTSGPATAAPSGKAEAGPESGKIREAMKSMEAQPAESRQAFAGAALAELTQGRLPEPLRKAFGDLQSAPLQGRRLILMKGLATPEAVSAWTAVCPAGATVLGDMEKLAPKDQGKHLVTTCKVGGDSLITPAEAERTDGIALAAALTAAQLLGKAEVERELLAFFLKASPAG
ncbi:MAG: hypothetical protein HOV80_01050 [Polyangiaceae bacterium]|nr:hypothetical protein [Polyangiaceae bacterium]